MPGEARWRITRKKKYAINTVVSFLLQESARKFMTVKEAVENAK
jgi:hypothetical protein